MRPNGAAVEIGLSKRLVILQRGGRWEGKRWSRLLSSECYRTVEVEENEEQEEQEMMVDVLEPEIEKKEERDQD